MYDTKVTSCFLFSTSTKRHSFLSNTHIILNKGSSNFSERDLYPSLLIFLKIPLKMSYTFSSEGCLFKVRFYIPFCFIWNVPQLLVQE